MRKSRWLLLLIALLAAYAAAYRFAPRRYSFLGPYLEHYRQLAHPWEIYFYAPAAWAESLLIRAWPTLYCRDPQCPQAVGLLVLKYGTNNAGPDRYERRFESGPAPPPIEEVFPANTDILEEAAKKNPGHARRGNVTCKYYSCDLDEAEESLSKKYPRPWTIEKVVGWFEREKDPDAVRCLAYLLGATLDPRAALALGERLENPKEKIADIVDRGSAIARQLIHFIPMPKCGEEDEYEMGLHERGEGYQMKWFQQNKARLQKVCAALPSTEP